MRIWSITKSLLLGNRAGSRSRPTRLGSMRRPLLALTALAAAGAIAAGCGSNTSGSGSSGSSGSSPTTSGQSSQAAVTATSTKLGTILVDGSGRTLYLFEKDQPNKSACSGACAAAWPPDQISGTPKAGSGVNASLLGTIKRADGTTQVTYNHHPLYTFVHDTAAGQENGQGVDAFGAEWFVVAPSGGAVTGGNS